MYGEYLGSELFVVPIICRANSGILPHTASRRFAGPILEYYPPARALFRLAPGIFFDFRVPARAGPSILERLRLVLGFPIAPSQLPASSQPAPSQLPASSQPNPLRSQPTNRHKISGRGGVRLKQDSMSGLSVTTRLRGSQSQACQGAWGLGRECPNFESQCQVALAPGAG